MSNWFQTSCYIEISYKVINYNREIKMDKIILYEAAYRVGKTIKASEK